MARAKRNVNAVKTVCETMAKAMGTDVMYIDHNKEKKATRLKFFVACGNKQEAAPREAEMKQQLDEILPQMEQATGCKLSYYFRTAQVYSSPGFMAYMAGCTQADFMYNERYLYIWVPDAEKEVA